MGEGSRVSHYRAGCCQEACYSEERQKGCAADDVMGRGFGLTWIGLGQVHGVQWSHEFDLVACGF